MLNETKIFTVLAVTSYLAGAGLVLGQAQPAQQQSGQQGEMAELKKLQQEDKEIQARLAEIARKAEEKNPELGQMRQDLKKLFRKKLDEYGYPNEEELQRLHQMQEKLQNANMKQEKRQELTQIFQRQVASMERGRLQAQQDEEVLKMIEKTERERSKAMSEINENAQRLQQKMLEIQDKIRQLKHSIYQQHPQQR